MLNTSTLLMIISITSLFFWFKIQIGRVKTPYKSDFENYMDLDRQSNLTRRKDVSDEHFITPDISRMPIHSYPGNENARLMSLQESLIKASRLKMIRFDRNMTNTELKLMYGMASLEDISRYEDNYNGFLRATINYANELVERGYIRDAEIVLLEAIEFGSDLTQVYMLLADVYASEGKENELAELLDTVSAGGIWSASLTKKVADYIKTKIKNGE